MSKKNLESGWQKLSPKERQDKIDEIERWLLYRFTGAWFENTSIALLQEIYSLRKEIERLKAQDPTA